MGFNVTFMFKVGSEGWSETWYNDSSAESTVISQAKNLANARAAMLGLNASLTYIRISDPAIKRDLIFTRESTFNLPLVGSMGSSTQASAGALIKFFTSDNKRWGTRCLRGVPSSAFSSSNPNGFEFKSEFWSAFANFEEQLRRGSTSWKMRTAGGLSFKWKASLPVRASTKKAGRPFGLRRGRKFAHRVTPP